MPPQRDTCLNRLPVKTQRLLHQCGRIADRQGVGLYLVGGVVRDLLLKRHNYDLDLVVEGDGIRFARTLAETVNGRVMAHNRFGTATVVLPDDLTLDVATARRESYQAPAALPTVEPSSIRNDLYRRDFTINTLAMGLNKKGFGRILDLYGGQRDLDSNVIRILHEHSFMDDPTRLFRAVRFAVRFGFRMDRKTVVLLKRAVKVKVVNRLSGHRILEELKLLLSEREPKRALKQLANLDLLKFIHPKLSWSSRLGVLLHRLDRTVGWYRLSYPDQKMDVWLLYFMALLDVLPERALTEVLKRFPFAEPESTRLQMSHVGCRTVLRRLMSKRLLKPADVYHLLSGLSDETLLILIAKSKGKTVKRLVSAFLTTYQHVKPVLTGTDLKAMGFKPGPKFKQILDRLLDARLNGEIKTEAEERCLVEKMSGG